MDFNDTAASTSVRATTLVPLTAISANGFTTFTIPVDPTIRSVFVLYRCAFTYAFGEFSQITLRGTTSNVAYFGRNDSSTSFLFSWIEVAEIIPEVDAVLTLQVNYSRVNPVTSPMSIAVIGSSEPVAEQIYSSASKPVYVTPVTGDGNASLFPPVYTRPATASRVSSGVAIVGLNVILNPANCQLAQVVVTNPNAGTAYGTVNVDGVSTYVFICEQNKTLEMNLQNVAATAFVYLELYAGSPNVNFGAFYFPS